MRLFVASSNDSEVANGSTEELIIGVAGARPVKKARVWSSFIEGSEGESNKSDLERIAIFPLIEDYHSNLQ